LEGLTVTNLVYSDVTFGYSPKLPVLNNINFTLKTNEIIGVIGPNGAGKTTLLKLANGMIRPQRGKILIGTSDTKKYKTSDLAESIFVTFQFSRQQFFTPSVEKELLITLIQHEKEKNNQSKRLEYILRKFQLSDLCDHHPYILSGGEQRRLAIAIGMATSADFFLLDEPTANLDQKTLNLLGNTLREKRNQGKGILIVSHDIAFQLMLCDKIIVLINGTIQFSIRKNGISFQSQKYIHLLEN
jgi:energy-coupling factor transport system ATP-binding protein